ncbi:hypothetical protein D3C78_715470 [compost metagenome]
MAHMKAVFKNVHAEEPKTRAFLKMLYESYGIKRLLGLSAMCQRTIVVFAS